MQHSCLTRGDWLSVRHGTSHYDLKICALQPEPACSVIDTDLEVGAASCGCGLWIDAAHSTCWVTRLLGSALSPALACWDAAAIAVTHLLQSSR